MGRLGNHVHPSVQALFPNNDAVFQDDNAPPHGTGRGLKNVKVNIASSVDSIQSSYLNITEVFWSDFETRARNRSSPQTSLKATSRYDLKVCDDGTLV
jgi:hypothetical protein